MTVYVLTHSYADKSAFHICGVTNDPAVANAWYKANDETDLYELTLNEQPQAWDAGVLSLSQKIAEAGR